MRDSLDAVCPGSLVHWPSDLPHFIDSMETEIIDPPSVVTHIRSTYPEQFVVALERHTRAPGTGRPAALWRGYLRRCVAIIGYDTGKNTPTRNVERSISKSSSGLLQ